MKNKTDITIILDRSGSMDSVKDDTIGGFNNFLAEQKKIEGDAALSLIQFDNQYEVLYLDKDIKSAAKLTKATFEPRGSTALYDAIGKTINSVGERLAALPEEERPNKVLFMILTDGFENASREFDAAQICEMIKHQSNIYNWDFMFIGANQDAVLSAKEIGIPAHAALTYKSNSRGIDNAFRSASEQILFCRASPNPKKIRFTNKDREKQEKT